MGSSFDFQSFCRCKTHLVTTFRGFVNTDNFLSLSQDQLSEVSNSNRPSGSASIFTISKVLDSIPPVREESAAASLEATKLTALRRWVDAAVERKGKAAQEDEEGKGKEKVKEEEAEPEKGKEVMDEENEDKEEELYSYKQELLSTLLDSIRLHQLDKTVL